MAEVNASSEYKALIKAMRAKAGTGPDGHRTRLRARFLDGMGAGLSDYELLELLLTGFIPRIDVRALARSMIKEAGGLGSVMASSPERLLTFEGIGPVGLVAIKVVQEIGRRVSVQNLEGRHVLNNWQQLVDYCCLVFQHEVVENCNVILLNRRNHVIRSVRLAVGTVDRVPIYVREVAKVALNEGATAMVLVHNHPSGEAKPSTADLQITKCLKDALGCLDIVLHDHVIISRTDIFSFRNAGLISS